MRALYRLQETSRRLRRSHAVILTVLLTFSVLFFATLGNPAELAEMGLVSCGFIALLIFPEFALAIYTVVGDLKGDDRIAALFPCDLTVAIGVTLVLGILLNLIRKKSVASIPTVYFLFLVLAFMMAASLVYTPVFSAGLDKLTLFLTVTAIAILGPFFVLSDPQAMKRFFWCLGIAGYAICFASLSGLGGADRLVTPSDNTIGLGRVACVVAAMIWFSIAPSSSLKERSLGYVALTVPLIAMVGSGSRGSAAAFVLLVLVTLFFYKRRIFDIAALAIAGIAALPFIKIPDSSFDYLGSLAGARSVGALLDFRADLLDYGWKLLREHPLLGAGIGGFQYSSPNPGLYKWPHDIFLELACELGIPAALIGAAIFVSAIREANHQLRDSEAPHFTLSLLAAALLFIGAATAVTTGNINSDRTIWLFVSLVFVIRAYGQNDCQSPSIAPTAEFEMSRLANA
jgi:O-antigen ligase